MLADRPATPAWERMVRRSDQIGVRCVFMRGGTSRGAFLHAVDLPADPVLLERLILAIYGSPDVRQIDGLGGANPLTSKVAIVGPASRPDADVDFVFGQVRIDEARVDFDGNCGNLSAGVGPFAIDEGLVPATEPATTVAIHLVNTGSLLRAVVPVQDGRAAVEGPVEVDGVPGTAAGIVLDFGEGSGALGRGVLPTGRVRETVRIAEGEIEVSIVDAANPVVFARAESLGLSGTEGMNDFDKEAIARLLQVRDAAAVELGLAGTPSEAATATPAIPKVYIVAPPTDYTDMRGRPVTGSQIHVAGRGLSMGAVHQAYAGTAAICTGVAASIPGTVVHEVAIVPSGDRFRIGHPSGCIDVEVRVRLEGSSPVVERAALVRTARRIMEGTVYVPVSRVFSA